MLRRISELSQSLHHVHREPPRCEITYIYTGRGQLCQTGAFID
jgi:hypothetical protein